MTEDQVKELVKTKREELSSLLPAEIKKKAEFYIDKIFSMLSFETKPMAVEFLIDFYKFVYDIPASPDVDFFGAHHQQEFGLFLHSLEVCWETLKRTQNRTLIKQKDGVFFSSSYYTTKSAQEYVIFLTSLCHDIGKVLTYKVINRSLRTVHKPFLMSLYDFKKQTEDAEMEIQFTPYDHRHFSLLLFCLLSKSDLEFLTEPKPTQGYSLDGIEYLFDILLERGETDFGRIVLDEIKEADKTSAVQYMKEEQPEYELIKKFLQKQYKEYYSKRFLFKSAEYTAFHFPFIVKEIARNVLRLKIDDRETIEEKMKGKVGEEEKAKKKLPYSVLSKVISLLEENLLYSDDGRYIHKIRNKLNQNLEYKVIFLNNSLFGEIPLSLPDTLSEWEVVLSGEDSTSPEEQPTGETEKVMITEPVNSSSPNETEFPEAPKEESEEEKMYNYFKTLLIVKLSSVEEIAENRNKKKEVVFKDMKEKFPVFDSIMLTSFLDRIKKERETEIIEEMEQGDEDGEGDLS